MNFTLHQATLEDYPIIQNMARFYVYDLSRECGVISKDWAMPSDGLYECFDFKRYFEEEGRHAFLIKSDDELAGFVLLDKEVKDSNSTWNMGEFFVISKFQGKNLGAHVAKEILNRYPGIWEVSVIPENKSGFRFWERTIKSYTSNRYTCEVKEVPFDKDQPHRIIFTFHTHDKLNNP